MTTVECSRCNTIHTPTDAGPVTWLRKHWKSEHGGIPQQQRMLIVPAQDVELRIRRPYDLRSVR